MAGVDPVVTPRRDLLLTERRGRLCRLPSAEADFLRARHGTALDLAPTATRHRYRVTPAGVAGVILTPWRRVVISPKIPISNLLYLLDPAARDAGTDRARPADGRAVVALLAALFAGRLEERLAAGLHADYRERDRRGPFLVGRLDVAAQLRESRPDTLHCREDHRTADLPCNRLLRAAAARLAGSPLLDGATRARMTRALGGLAGVSDIALSRALDHDHSPPGYEPLLALARLLAQGLAPDVRSGETPGPALLVSLERLFERHVTRAALAAFGPGEVVAQETTVLAPGGDRPGLSVRPDVVIRRGDAVLVVDAKWKRPPREALHTDDVYQVVSYAALLGARRAVLVYPGRRRPVEYAFAHTPLRLEVRGLDVAGPIDRCARAARRLGRALRGDG